ncbi:MAG: 50S ribosomal protein L23 [Oscillospiraceae bacterium]|nr:50S ribosomal protein L23 [Oscillospiraceae bacterium]
MKTAYDVIIRPVISEMSMDMIKDRKYVFRVMKTASKPEIKQAVEEVFKGAKVAAVNTINVKAKKKRLGMGRPEGTRPAWKKAIVTLKPDSETIAFFDGMF